MSVMMIALLPITVKRNQGRVAIIVNWRLVANRILKIQVLMMAGRRVEAATGRRRTIRVAVVGVPMIQGMLPPIRISCVNPGCRLPGPDSDLRKEKKWSGKKMNPLRPFSEISTKTVSYQTYWLKLCSTDSHGSSRSVFKYRKNIDI